MTWKDVAPRAAVREGMPLEVEVGRAALLLYEIAGMVFATDAICPHHAAWLSQGSVQGETVNCPRHMGQFHVPTGRKLRGPDCPDLRTYRVQVEGARVLVEVG